MDHRPGQGTASRGGKRLRPPRPRKARWQRIAALAVAAAGLAAATAACGASGGSPNASATTAGPATYQQMIAYAQCIRSHGAPAFPDPVQDQFGHWVFLSTPGSGLNGPGVPAAENACKKLQPNEVVLTPQEREEALAQLLKFSECVPMASRTSRIRAPATAASASACRGSTRNPRSSRPPSRPATSTSRPGPNPLPGPRQEETLE
jgi:hypothetical protein